MIGMALSLMFGVGGFAKLLARRPFTITVATLLPDWRWAAIRSAALGVMLLEICTCLLFAIGSRPAVDVAATSSCALAAIFGSGYYLSRRVGESVSCNCFGGGASTLSRLTVVRAVAIAGLGISCILVQHSELGIADSYLLRSGAVAAALAIAAFRTRREVLPGPARYERESNPIAAREGGVR